MNYQGDLLLSVCAGLGRLEANGGLQSSYNKTNDCLGCLKDLQRFLRRDDHETRDVFFKLGDMKLAETDLVPIITTYPEDRDLVINALKVLTFLTMPVDPASDHPERQARIMQLVKNALLKPGAIAVIVALVAEAMGRHPRMSEDDNNIVQLVLTVFRNLLCIPDASAMRGQSGGDHMTRLQATLLHALFEENVMELLLIAAQHANERPFKVELSLLLEIFREIFRGLAPENLAAAVEPLKPALMSAAVTRERQRQHQVQRGSIFQPQTESCWMGRQQLQREQQRRREGAHPQQAGPAATGLALVQARLKEEADRRATKLGPTPAHHGRIGAQFVRRLADGGVSTYLRNPRAAELPTLAPGLATGNATVSALGAAPELLWRLRHYADRLLLGGYSVLMEAARRELEPGLGISRLDRNDFVAFLNLGRFFTSYLRHRHLQQKVPSAPTAAATASTAGMAEGTGSAAAVPQTSPFAGISASMGWETFHMVQTLWISQIDVPLRSGEKDWEIQHASMAMLKEMLLTLDEAERSGSLEDRRAADRLQRRLLHDDLKESGLLPLLGRLMKCFSSKYEGRQHAADLIQGVHVVLLMYDRLTSTEASGFLVRRRAGGRGGRRQAATEPLDESAADGDEAAAAATPAASATGSLSSNSKAGQLGEGGEAEGPSAASPGGLAAAATKARERDPMEELEETGSEADEGGGPRNTREVTYDLSRRLRQELAVPSVLQFYVRHLRGYATNAALTNRGICDLLWRVALPEQLNLQPMLYQLSALRVFHAILSDPTLRRPDKMPAYKDMLSLCTYVVRGLFKRLVPPTAAAAAATTSAAAAAATTSAAATLGGGDDEVDDKQQPRPTSPQEVEREDKILNAISSMLFVDMLFWKTAPVAEEINADYFMRVENVGSLDLRSASPGTHVQLPHGGGGGGSSGRRFANLGDDDGDNDGDDASDRGAEDGLVVGSGGVAAAVVAAQRPRNLVKERERLRKLHIQQQRQNAPRPSVLNGEGLIKLKQLFERNNSSRHNLDNVVRGLGGGLTEEQVIKELRNMNLKFGQLTEVQLAKLRDLYQRHKHDDDFLLLITAEMTGGWTSKDVKRLLRKHSIAGGKGQQEEGGEEEAYNTDDELYGFDDDQMRLLYAENEAEGPSSAVAAVAEALGDDIPYIAVHSKLQRLGLIPKAGAKGASRGKPGQVPPALLRKLHAEHCNGPDMLNLLAAKLPGGLSVQQVQRLLRKHGLVEDGAGGRCKGLQDAEERARLVHLFHRHKGEEGYLKVIAAELGNGRTPARVASMLRKAKLLEAKEKKPSGQASGGGSQRKGEAGGGNAADVGRGIGGAVPEPDACKVLMYLKAMEKASDGRWMGPQAAAKWLLDKVDKAESLWSLTQPPHVDYAIVIDGTTDHAFFMTDYAQELLEAAGFRNDEGDYFKLPGNSDAAWRGRLRTAVQHALKQLNSVEAERLASQVPDLVAPSARWTSPPVARPPCESRPASATAAQRRSRLAPLKRARIALCDSENEGHRTDHKDARGAAWASGSEQHSSEQDNVEGEDVEPVAGSSTGHAAGAARRANQQVSSNHNSSSSSSSSGSDADDASTSASEDIDEAGNNPNRNYLPFVSGSGGVEASGSDSDRGGGAVLPQRQGRTAVAQGRQPANRGAALSPTGGARGASDMAEAQRLNTEQLMPSCRNVSSAKRATRNQHDGAGGSGAEDEQPLKQQRQGTQAAATRRAALGVLAQRRAGKAAGQKTGAALLAAPGPLQAQPAPPPALQPGGVAGKGQGRLMPAHDAAAVPVLGKENTMHEQGKQEEEGNMIDLEDF